VNLGEGLTFGAINAALLTLLGLAMRTVVASTVERVVEQKFRAWEVRFSKLHERRVEVMEGLQDRLVKLQGALDLAGGLDPKHVAEAAEALIEAEHFTRTRRYYFPKETADQLLGLLLSKANAIHGGFSGLTFYLRRGKDIPDAALKRAEQAFTDVASELPHLMAKLEEEFRRLVRGETDAFRGGQ
jgi:hypothetical protein